MKATADKICILRWWVGTSNSDTLGTEESVLISVVSGLVISDVSRLVRCPDFRIPMIAKAAPFR